MVRPGRYHRARSMASERIASAVAGVSDTSNSPAATPRPIIFRKVRSIASRTAATARKWAGSRAASSYWATRAAVWWRACQAVNAATAACSCRAGSPEADGSGGMAASAASCAIRLIRKSRSSLVR